MNMSLAQTDTFIRTNKEDLVKLAANPSKKIILCPSFPALVQTVNEVKNSSICIAAQNCSAQISGSFTGQVDAVTLAQAGCTYCIIGHSECRVAFKETDEEIAAKANQLIAQHIIPIVCIGENLEQKTIGTTQEILAKQLAPLIYALKNYVGKLCIAYEPIWAIGTGHIPSKQELQKTCDFLATYIKNHLTNVQLTLIYGGSVDETNAQEILSIAQIGGLLIGGASLNFQKFQKIVSLAK